MYAAKNCFPSISIFLRASNLLGVGSVMLLLSSCSYFSSNASSAHAKRVVDSSKSADQLTLIDEQHYYVNQLYLDSESSLDSSVVTQQFAWLTRFDERRSRSQQDLALQSAYELLMHDKVREAKNLLQGMMQDHADYQPAKLLYDTLVSNDPSDDELAGEKVVVSVGDSWQSLAQKYYASPLQFYRLVRMNHAKASQQLEPGQLIIVPNTAVQASPLHAVELGNDLPSLKPTARPSIPSVSDWIKR